MASFYEVLGVARTATEEEIRRAFTAIARSTHPDTHPGDAAAAQRFKEASEAHACLTDPAQRAEYDRTLGAYAGLDPETVETIQFLQDRAGEVIAHVRSAQASGVPVQEQAKRVGQAAWDGLKTPAGKERVVGFFGSVLRALHGR